MSTKERRQSAGAKDMPQSSKAHSLPYVTRYVAVDSHLTDRSGSTDFVYGLAGERPAGRKLAQDVASVCNELYSKGYEVISMLPLTSGRVVEATVEAEEPVHGRTFSKEVPVEPESDSSSALIVWPAQERKHYVDTGAGYSVTDGVVITAKLRE